MDSSSLSSEELLRTNIRSCGKDLESLVTVLFMGFRVMQFLGFDDYFDGILFMINLFIVFKLL